MPLRDHFRPPVWRRASWEGFHGMWPATIVQQLSRELPPEFTAEPRALILARISKLTSVLMRRSSRAP